ncbi:hypothetical protein [Streptomyces sp. RerS4]|uniref:hypothetical protein n=1 Tax=Streptomyces sp. RerS4 TaxID=2942449 RepID=UPI00201C5A7B|nr:hypothetical protein [Streptomyces sp. RerS4]UQX04606.1 hypothetical protein M4D82_31900 [Streptomyces sp. RerS4]
MSVTDVKLRAEYGAAVERMVGRALDALKGVEGTCGPAQPLSRAEPAALRVLGPDVFTPRLLASPASGHDAAREVAEAYRVFPPAVGGDAVARWLDWATWTLASRNGSADPAPAPAREPAPARPAGPFFPVPDCLPAADGWRPWSLAMARLAPLALPGLDSPLHDAARADPLALARGTVRAMLRRDHRTAARLVRWLAWLAWLGRQARLTGPAGPSGPPGVRGPVVPEGVPVEIEPLITRLKQVGDGSARTA